MIDKNIALTQMKQDMVLRGLAKSTQDNYQRYAGKYLEYSGGKVDEESIRNFLAYLLKDRKLAPGTVNMYNAAIRFLLEITLDITVNHRRIPRLREHRGLPEILTKEELLRIFEHATPLRNRAMLVTAYGGGLRISEICSLKVCDIDSEAMRIFIRDSKGRKDRYTLLSAFNLDVLREYWKSYRPQHPDGWLFLNKDGTEHAGKRTLQVAFDRSLERANIHKDVTVHTLRASFATHLLESGIDFFTVKRLLGHADMKSTTRYLGVIKFDASLKSPLDSLPKKRGRKAKAGIAHG